MPFRIDPLECRRLLATWSDYAQLIRQDEAASVYASLTGAGQAVAMIDTGIDYTVAELGGGFGSGKKVVGGYDFYANDSDPMDTDGHGTMTASMVAASPFTVGGVTYRGIAPDANLVALRVGTSDDISNANIEKALKWVISNHEKFGITVVNISLGSGGDSSFVADEDFADEFATLRSLGIVTVAASGNSGDRGTYVDTVSSPSSDPSVFAVGSVDADGSISDFTQRSSILGLLAPGSDVYVTTKDDDYDAVDGTSFSSPMVAGVFALLNQATSNLGVADLESVVRASSETVYDGTGTGITTGRAYARLDLVDAIALAKSRDASYTLDYIAASKSTAIDSAYDQSGVLHLAYYDTATRKVMYTTQSSAGKWARPAVVDTSNADLGASLSLAIDPTGKVGIAYYDATDGDLKYAWQSDNNWTSRTLDTNKSVGQNPSLVFTADGDPAVAYYRKTSQDLRLMTYDHTTGQWSRQTIDSAGDVGTSASIAYWASDTNADDSTLAIAYSDRTNGSLKYWRYNSNDLTNNGILQNTVDDLKGQAANIDVYLGSVGGQVQVRIAYQDTANQDVKFAYRNSTWFTKVVADGGSVGSQVKGYVDADGNYHVVYFNKTKKATYDATISTSTAAVTSTSRVGTIGSVMTLATNARDSTVALVGLNRVGKSLDEAIIS